MAAGVFRFQLRRNLVCSLCRDFVVLRGRAVAIASGSAAGVSFRPVQDGAWQRPMASL